MNKTDWKKMLIESAGKLTINDKAPDKKLISFHASSMARKMEKKFPSVAYAAQLGREKKPFLQHHDEIKDFLNKHEDFELHKTNIDLFLKKKKLASKKNDGMRNELKKIQRVFRYAPQYDKTNALLQNKIHSAQSIVAAGKSRFVNDIAPKAGIAQQEATTIFKKAAKAHTASMLIAGDLQDTLRSADIPALKMDTLSAKLDAISKDFPNLKSLFQLTDSCECEHCRSVYSPAAYLVEILQFLDNRNVIDLTAPPPPPPAIRPDVRIAKDVLFERRPDLGDIDLGCENAETALPYIDLVCELLEEAITPDPGIDFTGDIFDDITKNTGKLSAALLTTLQTAKLPVTDKALIYETESTTGAAATQPHYLRDTKLVCKIINNGANNWTIKRLRQTLSSAAELAAAPQYVNEAAYETLNSPANAFAFSLPFDLHQTEASAYFDRFGISRAELMSNFQIAANPSDETIAVERLGLTDIERQLIVTADPANQQLYWNTAPTSAVDAMKVVDTFLTKTGLDYNELTLLLALKFIDPADNLFIKNIDTTLDSCDTTKKTIANLDNNALDRMHRFLRLQKKTGWKFEILDEIICQSKLGDGALDDNCLKIAAAIQTIVDATSFKIEELVCCYVEFPHADLPGIYSSLYDSIFQNKAKNGFIEPGLSAENISANEAAAVKKQLADFKTTISVCLHIKETDFYKLISTFTNTDLSFANLSMLYAYSRLIRVLKITTDDFLILEELTGLDIFKTPALTKQFIDAVEVARKIPLKPADIKFMLKHEAANLADREIKDQKTETTLKALQLAYQESFLANASPYDDTIIMAEEQKERTANLLSKLSLLNEADVKIIINFTDRIWNYSWTDENYIEHTGTTAIDAPVFINDKKLDRLFDTSSILSALNLLAAAADANLEDAKKAFLKSLLDTVSGYLFKTDKQTILVTTLTSVFKSNTDLTQVVLINALLKQTLPGTELLIDLLTTDTLIDTVLTHASPVLPIINEVDFAKSYSALRLMHKLFPLISAFKMDNAQVEWFLENNAALGWFELDSIPYEAGQTAVDYGTFISFAAMFARSNNYSPVVNPADAENPLTFYSVMEMLLPGSASTRSRWIDSLALLTGHDKDNLDALDSYFNFSVLPDPADLSAYRLSKTWTMVETAASYLRKLGVTTAQVTEFIKPVLTNDDANQLRMCLKALYDETTWLDTLKQISDAIRPQKRDALVAYLLAVNPDMKDANDLFDYFLVDTQMESCMPSSRIVQAHGTVQLFVQRCLMGLESAAADITNDADWQQWEWMKNYRVWEANRKVFLYPENWIEAELLDDKSFLFDELINESRQNELTTDVSEGLFINYLEKMDDIAFLEVVATWYQADIFTMHVFARTKGGDPAIYYYRRFEKERYWTPWEKVELDISGNHLLAFVRNNRLCLAWPVFSDEPNPVQTSTIPAATTGNVVENEKPTRKLKVQLAISELSNNKWKAKKVSTDAIKTPTGNYTNGDIPREYFKFFYNEPAEQVVVFNTVFNWIEGAWQSAGEALAGAFDIAGCKGYPELVGAKPFSLYFIPKFRDTALLNQRYRELGHDKTDDLAVINAQALLWTKQVEEILLSTPGTFRITYPHQFTKIDLVVLLFELLMMKVSASPIETVNNARRIWMPLGTLLPYFMEDSHQAYVIVPGFYKKNESNPSNVDNSTEAIDEKRTASDVLVLLDDILALFNKYLALYLADATHNIHAILQALIADADYQKILTEIKLYKQLSYGEPFYNMYHPLICFLRKIVYKNGIAELMKRDTQLKINIDFDFENYYNPNINIVPPEYLVEDAGIKKIIYPREDIDFTSNGSYSAYNWEMFFHIPFLLASKFTADQRFEEALTQLQYIFNPTGALDGPAPEKYWMTKPFYQTHAADYINQRLDHLFYKMADPSTPERAELEFAIEEWRNKPFKPHVVARFRTVAYQKAVLMKYINNLVEWGDYLFRQDTMESIAQATQMYILADKLLGPKPRLIPPAVKPPYETYNQLAAKLDAFGNALIDIENILPDFSVLPEGGAELPTPVPVTLSMLYFCIPQNDNMLEYWSRIENRLFNIRHCRNIDGVERTLALFAPPIDPGMLVRAAAAGLSISSILAGMNAPVPSYRFNVLSQKATEFTQELRTLGSSLLQALEKKDAEALSLLRSDLDIRLLKAVREIKLLSIKEAKEQIEILNRTKAITEERDNYYTNIQKIIPKEQLNLNKLKEAHDFQLNAQVIEGLGGIYALIPDVKLGAYGFGGAPAVDASFGGVNLSTASRAAASVFNIFSSMAAYEANTASITGGYDRRYDDWKLQERLAKKELDSIDAQITAAQLREEISEKDLQNHDLQIEHAQKTDEFMRSKFTNDQLYDWMIGQISSIYFRSYQLAFDFAKKAERCYRFELGNDDVFISYGYWDSMKKGLQSADNLVQDIKRMEANYIDKNKREYEITKHVSLKMLDPLALVKLRATGICDFDIPEALYDMDYSGQYFRRIKSVSISLPCIAGPYTSVSAKLSLVNNRYRKNTDATAGYEEVPVNDERFMYNIGAIQSIAASNAQNDSGIFELNFRDERYLPFECAGAISSWRLELPTQIRQFDYNSISDVIMHVKYTAREGGSGLKLVADSSLSERLTAIKQELAGEEGLHIYMNMKYDLPNEWYSLKKNATVDLKIDKSRLPYLAQTLDAAVENVVFIARIKDNPGSFTINIDHVATNLSLVDDWNLCKGDNSNIEIDSIFNLAVAASELENLEELIMLVKYSF